MDPGFELFETLRIEGLPQQPQAPLRDAHLARLARSAQALGFTWREAEVAAALDHAVASLRQNLGIGTPQARLRMSLNHRGAVTIHTEPLPDLAPGPVLLSLSPLRLPNAQPLAAHKTTLRQHYDAAVREAIAQGQFDQLFVTEGGWLTEGGRSTVLVKLHGQWCTPPVADGALPGVARAQVLAQGLEGQRVLERRIGLEELAQAQDWRVCNALRGVLPAQLVRLRDSGGFLAK